MKFKPATSKSSVARRTAAFTLAEVLAALTFMAIVIPVAIEGLRIANRAGVVAQRKTVAARVADSVLNEALVAPATGDVAPAADQDASVAPVANAQPAEATAPSPSEQQPSALPVVDVEIATAEPPAIPPPALAEADACSERGDVGALLRREGLYSSHLDKWRTQRGRGALQALTPQKRGPKIDPQAEEMASLRGENERLQVRLQQAETIIEVQKNSLRCLDCFLRR